MLIAGIALLFVYPEKGWLVYVTGGLHTLVLTSTIGRWVVEEREKRLRQWLRDATDAAEAMRAVDAADPKPAGPGPGAQEKMMG